MSGSCIPSASLAAMNARGYLQDINNTKHSGRMMIFTPAILGVKGESRLGGGFSWVSNAIFAFPSIFFCDWCKKLALYSQTIKCKLKSRFKQSEHFSPRVATGSLQHFCLYWMVLWFFFRFWFKTILRVTIKAASTCARAEPNTQEK